MASGTDDEGHDGEATFNDTHEQNSSLPMRPRKRKSPSPETNSNPSLISQVHKQAQADCFHFFNLPAELRIMIYKQALIPREPIEIMAWSGNSHEHINHRNLAALLMTCRQAYNEAMPILYGLNIFRISGAFNALEFLNSIGSAQLNALRSLTFDFLLRVSTRKVVICADDVYGKLAEATGLQQLQFKIGYYEYSLYKIYEGLPEMWHPVTALRGRLKKVEIVPVSNVYGLPPNVFDGVVLRDPKFEELRTRLIAVLMGSVSA